MSVELTGILRRQGTAGFAAFHFDTYTVWDGIGLLEPAAGVEPATF
jgi:hypothetical protein